MQKQSDICFGFPYVGFVGNLPVISVCLDKIIEYRSRTNKKGQTQCTRLPHKVGSEEGLQEPSLISAKCSAEKLVQNKDLLAQVGRTSPLHQGLPSNTDHVQMHSENNQRKSRTHISGR